MGIFFNRRNRERKELREDFITELMQLSQTVETDESILLGEKVDQLNLICRALWSYLKEHLELSDEDLAGRIEEIKKNATLNCPKCGHTVHYKNNKCIYCGFERPDTSLFDRL